MTSILRFVISENTLNFIALFQLKSHFLNDRLSITIPAPPAFSKSVHKIQTAAEFPKPNHCPVAANTYSSKDNTFWNNTSEKGPQKCPVAHRALCGQEEGQADTSVTPAIPRGHQWRLVAPLQSQCSLSLAISKRSFCSVYLLLVSSTKNPTNKLIKPATMPTYAPKYFSKYLIHTQRTYQKR